MRVLMISDVYFPPVNGVSTSIQTFARGLVASGQEVTLIAPDYGSRSGQGQAEPFEVLRLPSRYLPLDPEDRILRPGRIMALLTAADTGLTRRGVDVLHIQTPFVAHYTGLALARRLGVPVVESYHTFFEQYLSGYIPLIPSAWLKMAARRFSASQGNAVDALVVPSQAMREVLAQGRGCLIAEEDEGHLPPRCRTCSRTPRCADSSAPRPRPTRRNGLRQPWPNGCWTSTGKPWPDPEAGTESAKP